MANHRIICVQKVAYEQKIADILTDATGPQDFQLILWAVKLL